MIRQIVRRRRGDAESSGGDEDGFECCGFCRICTCLRWGFLATPTGVLKAVEMVGDGVLRNFPPNIFQRFGFDRLFMVHVD